MLRRLGMVGVSWRSGTESLGQYSLTEEECEVRLAALVEKTGLEEVAYIATCNRVEVIFVRPQGAANDDIRKEVFEMLTGAAPQPGEAETTLKAWAGEGAAEHLFIVTAALDSAALGEAEISGQVRAAHERSREFGFSGPVLDLLFGEALRVAAKVRANTELGAGRVSLAEIAVELAKRRRADDNGKIALLGVSPMTERAAVSLHGAGAPLIVINRSVGRAAALAEQTGGEYLSLDEFRAAPPTFAALISATGSTDPVVDEAVLSKIAKNTTAGTTPLLIDMAVPPDVDPQAAEKCGVERVGMNEIVAVAQDNRKAREQQAAAARELVDEALVQLNERIVEGAYGPLMGTLQRRYQRTATEGVKRLLKKDLTGLGEAEQAAIETWAEVLARRFAHIPCLGLRGLLSDGPEGSVDAFIGGLEDEFAEELRASLRPKAAGNRQ